MRGKADDIRGYCDPISDMMYKLRVLIKYHTIIIVSYDNKAIVAYHYHNNVILHHTLG